MFNDKHKKVIVFVFQVITMYNLVKYFIVLLIMITFLIKDL